MDENIKEIILTPELDVETSEEIISETPIVEDGFGSETEKHLINPVPKENQEEEVEEVEENIELVNEKLIKDLDVENEEEYKYEDIINRLDNLKESFDESIKYDSYKDQLFDNLHKELTQYKNGILDKIIDTMAMDLIQMIDTTKKTSNLYKTKEFSEDNYKRLLGLFEGIAEDLQDVIYRQSVEPYSILGDEVDVKKQRIISTEETTDIDLDNKVATRLSEGYEKNGQILRPERISIYKYKEDKGEN